MTSRPDSSTDFMSIAIVDSGHHSIHIFEQDGKTHIVVKDHCRITLDGDYHNTPTVIVDSEEYETRLKVQQTESKWVSVDCLPEEGKRIDSQGKEWRKVWMMVPCQHEMEDLDDTTGRCKKCGELIPKNQSRPWYTKEEMDERFRYVADVLQTLMHQAKIIPSPDPREALLPQSDNDPQ